MSIPNLGKLIKEKYKQTPGFMIEPDSEESKMAGDMAKLFEALFKYLDVSNKQIIGILKAINHDQKEVLSRLKHLDPDYLEEKNENKEESKEE
jgi:hypothetical protein